MVASHRFLHLLHAHRYRFRLLVPLRVFRRDRISCRGLRGDFQAVAIGRLDLSHRGIDLHSRRVHYSITKLGCLASMKQSAVCPESGKFYPARTIDLVDDTLTRFFFFSFDSGLRSAVALMAGVESPRHIKRR